MHDEIKKEERNCFKKTLISSTNSIFFYYLDKMQENVS